MKYLYNDVCEHLPVHGSNICWDTQSIDTSHVIYTQNIYKCSHPKYLRLVSMHHSHCAIQPTLIYLYYFLPQLPPPTNCNEIKALITYKAKSAVKLGNEKAMFYAEAIWDLGFITTNIDNCLDISAVSGKIYGGCCILHIWLLFMFIIWYGLVYYFTTLL